MKSPILISSSFWVIQYIRKGDKFQYTYDYGDDWQHDIEVLETIEFGSKKPLILEGTGACPKENSR